MPSDDAYVEHPSCFSLPLESWTEVWQHLDRTPQVPGSVDPVIVPELSWGSLLDLADGAKDWQVMFVP